MFIGWRKPSIIVSDTARMYVHCVRTLCTLSRTAKCYFVNHSLTYYNRGVDPCRFCDAEARCDWQIAAYHDLMLSHGPLQIAWFISERFTQWCAICIHSSSILSSFYRCYHSQMYHLFSRIVVGICISCKYLQLLRAIVTLAEWNCTLRCNSEATYNDCSLELWKDE